jgi:hypothetical protein
MSSGLQERPRTLSWRATPARRSLSPHIVHNIAGLWNLQTPHAITRRLWSWRHAGRGAAVW